MYPFLCFKPPRPFFNHYFDYACCFSIEQKQRYMNTVSYPVGSTRPVFDIARGVQTYKKFNQLKG